MVRGSRTNRRSAIHTATQHIEAPNTAGLLAERECKKCRARGDVRKENHQHGTRRLGGWLLRFHVAILGNWSGKGNSHEVRCSVHRKATLKLPATLHGRSYLTTGCQVKQPIA